MKKFSIILKRFLLNKGSAFGGIFLLIIIIGAIFAPLIAPYNWNEVDTGPRLAPPSWEFLFGTDIEYPIIFAPNVININDIQLPLKPVWPVIKTFLFKNIL